MVRCTADPNLRTAFCRQIYGLYQKRGNHLNPPTPLLFFFSKVLVLPRNKLVPSDSCKFLPKLCVLLPFGSLSSSKTAVGENKPLRKGFKKGAKKKLVGPFSKKDWYDVKAPPMFQFRNIGKTLVTRTQGTRISSEGLKGRVFEESFADLQSDKVVFRKFKLITEVVQGKKINK